MTEWYYMSEGVTELAAAAVRLADRAFTLGCEVAVVRFRVGGMEQDPWGVAMAVATHMERTGRYRVLMFIDAQRRAGENVPGHYEVRKVSHG